MHSKRRGRLRSDLLTETDSETAFDEVEEMELAANLLEVTDEQELDQFLGKATAASSRERHDRKDNNRRVGDACAEDRRRFCRLNSGRKCNLRRFLN